MTQETDLTCHRCSAEGVRAILSDLSKAPEGWRRIGIGILQEPYWLCPKCDPTACPQCGSMKVTLVYRKFLDADFSREGAIAGHPFLTYGGEQLNYMFCSVCGKTIEEEIVAFIRQEVI